MIYLFKTRWKLISTFSLLIALFGGNVAHAAEEFFWSDVEPALTCYDNRDGEAGELGIIKDGKKVNLDISSCKEAKNNRVLVLLNGKYLNVYAGSGAEPFSDNGRTMIPLRALADGFGFEVDWDQKNQQITLKHDQKSIILHVGKSEMWVDGKKVNLEDAVPTVKNGVTFLPIRQLAEVLGVKVDWNNATRTATFTVPD